MLTEQPYEIGQTVYVAMAEAHSMVDEECPVCAGHLAITLILGDGEHVKVACRFCERGYLGPQGTVGIYRATSKVYKCRVSGLKLNRADKWEVEVDAPVYGFSQNDIFTDKEAAEARRVELFADAKQRADDSADLRIRGARHSKDYSWSVGYHRREIESCERSMKWHQEQVRRIEAETGAGSCKHCNKSFKNLQRHLERQHPEAIKC